MDKPLGSVWRSGYIDGRELWEISESPTDGGAADIARSYTVGRERCSEVREQATLTNLQFPRRGCLVNFHTDNEKTIRIKDYLTCEERHSVSNAAHCTFFYVLQPSEYKSTKLKL
ncbi:hypothetical protein NPIL_105391 [Nephila pilipes]|uniref:Uncharacterized protein n=1 Tax=Nephila pilipes TaxID=299642 RepID=A0A8X6QTR5_NEPPI|nr:hypothetical protein NPIL_105391 [Nephila pilipes]